MIARLLSLPLIVAMMVFSGFAMQVPAIYAAVVKDWESARAFCYSGIIFIALTSMVAIAISNRNWERSPRAPLFDLVLAFVALPIMLAVPVSESIDELPFFDAYFEMVSSLTTTGATVLDGVSYSAMDAVHLWRGIVGWLGGFLMWVMAIAVLAPLNLGGFEVLGGHSGSRGTNFSQISKTANASTRLRHYAELLLPIYLGLTVVLWLALYMTGDTPLVSLCLAMATLSTSGITPEGASPASIGGEMAIFVFLIFALSRRTFTRDTAQSGAGYLFRDPELRAGISCIAILTVLLFLRHWVGSLEGTASEGIVQSLRVFWAGAFNVMSFLTTTGLQSAAWAEAEAWSDLKTPALIFLGLALVGGGVATTAGGVKLLRVDVLFRHGQREIDRLVHPNSVGGAGAEGRGRRRRGAFVAWIFFMLFAMSIAAITLALSLSGLSFEPTVVLAVATLSTTGPLVDVLGEDVLLYSTLTGFAKLVLCLSMILGRLETLAIISLLNPEFWRR